jgi:carbon starvation protein
VVLAWGYFLWSGVNDPLGGIYQLFPLFGIANQLLAAVGLALATTLIIKSGRARYAWVTLVPLAWDAVVTLTASWYKVFSADPKLGFFAQQGTYQAAIDAGKVLAPAKTMDAMHQIVTNALVDGVLSALFAVLVIIVILDASRIWVKALSTREPLPLMESPVVPSQIVAPAGLWPTADERKLAAARRTLDAVRWYLREVAGESSYERYVEHESRENPGLPVMSRQKFERQRQDYRDRTLPQSPPLG